MYVDADRSHFLVFLVLFVDCKAPFVYSDCGAPCEKHCALQGHGDLCSGVRECTPGCYCPQVNFSLALFCCIVCTGYSMFTEDTLFIHCQSKLPVVSMAVVSENHHGAVLIL